MLRIVCATRRTNCLYLQKNALRKYEFQFHFILWIALQSCNRAEKYDTEPEKRYEAKNRPEKAWKLGKIKINVDGYCS